MPNQTYGQIINDEQIMIFTVTTFDNMFDNTSTSTVVMMIMAWLLLIIGFSICCCSQCFSSGFWSSKWRSCGLDGGISERGDDLYDSQSITTVAGEIDRTNNISEPVDICRNYPPNYEAESLPSYTIVSGLPSYDDAIEEFRKAGIILAPPIPIIKIFEVKDSKDICNVENGISESDNVSVASLNTTCTCGNGLNSNNSSSQQYLATQSAAINPTLNAPFIELTPEQLAQLSQKRLSLQIAFPPAVRRNSRPRVDMRNNLLRSRAVNNTAGYDVNLPPIHRSTSSFSLAQERNMQLMHHNQQHRGSLF